MRDWAIWYRNLVIAWFLIALPGIVIGYGMAGGDVGIPGRDADLLSVLIWLLCVGFLFSPILFWPVRRKGRKPGFD
jgi:hypothetical protein